MHVRVLARVANLSLQPFQLFRAEPRLHAARVRSWTYYDPANPDYGGSCEGQVEESFCPGGERLSPQASLAVSDAAGRIYLAHHSMLGDLNCTARLQ